MTGPQRQAADISPRTMGLMAGVALLLVMLLSSFANFGVLQGLVVPADAGATVANMTASDGLFRIAIAAFLAVALLDVLAAWALYLLLRSINPGLALLMAWSRLAAAAVFAAALANLLEIARVRGDQAQVMASLASFDHGWAVSLAFFGLHLLVLGVLVLRSPLFPRFIGVLVIVAGGGYLADSFAAILAPDFAFTPSALTFFGQALLIFWLLMRAIRPGGRETDSRLADPIAAS